MLRNLIQLLLPLVLAASAFGQFYGVPPGVRSGTVAAIPATCNIGNWYWATDASPGANLYFCTALNTWTVAGGGGTVASVGFTGGLISVANPTTTPAFTVAGTSGAVVCFTGSATWAASAALTQFGPLLGGGAGACPTVVTPSTTTTHALFATATAPAFRAIDASDIASGQLTLARGGSGADLSATGGTSQFLKQASAGAVVTVVRPSCADLSDAGSGCTGTTGAGAVTAVTGTSPIVSSGGATPAISCATCGVTGSALSQFAATTSAQFFGTISDETGGTGVVVGSVSPALTGTATAVGFTQSGVYTNLTPGAVSAPAFTMTGAPFAGGSATTTKPLVLIEPTGATSTGWNTSGTSLGINATAASSTILELQNNGTSRVTFPLAGGAIFSGTAGVSSNSGSFQSAIFTTSANNVVMTVQQRSQNAAVNALSLVTGTMTQSTGQFNAVAITPTYNQTSTAAATDLLINRTQTAVGSGTQFYFDAQTAGTSNFTLVNTGNILARAIAAPATPASGRSNVYVDSTQKVLSNLNDAGTVTHTVATADCSATSNLVQKINSDGTVTCGAGVSSSPHPFGASFDGGGSALTAGKTSYFPLPYGCTIQAYTLWADTGTFTVKVWKIATGGTAIPTVSNSINTSGVSLSSGTKVRSTTLSDFTTTTVTALDFGAVNITAVSGATQLGITVECQ